MKTCVIDGEKITTREELYESIFAQMGIEDCGKNLDALYDMLTEFFEELCIKVVNREMLLENLGRYANMFITMITDAEEERSNIEVEFE